MEDQKTVLVVDDTPENIDVLVGILKQHYKVKAAPSGEKALKSSKKKPPDLILLDIMMPEMDGYEVCQKLKSDPGTAGIPVVFLSGEQDSSSQSKAYELGAVDFITKPINAATLKSCVENILN